MATDNRCEQVESMPKIDIVKDTKLRFTDVAYMKRMEKQNLERAKRVQAYRKRNKYSGIFLGLGALGIYIYTMYSFKQESFLDDFEMPEKVVEKTE